MNLRPILTAILLAGSTLIAACTAAETDRKQLADGFAAYESRRVDDAERAADAYIKKNPDAKNVDEAYYLRGLARYSRSDRPAAAQDLLTAIEKSKREDLRGKAYAILADMAYDGQRWEQAMEYLNKAVACYPLGKAPVEVYYRVGTTLQAMGQWDKARPYFDKVISMKPEPVAMQRAVQRRDATSFALQFGAYREGGNAAELVAQLKSAGLNCAVASEMREGQLFFLVREGKYSTYIAADLARQKLMPKYPLLIIVP